MSEKEMILAVIDDEPQKQKAILKKLRKNYALKISDRKLRSWFKIINGEYIDGSRKQMIVSNSKGCWLTSDFEEIERYNKSKKHHALSELYQAYSTEKRAIKHNQTSFEEFIKGLEREL